MKIFEDIFSLMISFSCSWNVLTSYQPSISIQNIWNDLKIHCLLEKTLTISSLNRQTDMHTCTHTHWSHNTIHFSCLPFLTYSSLHTISLDRYKPVLLVSQLFIDSRDQGCRVLGSRFILKDRFFTRGRTVSHEISEDSIR
jgi:hypothetical protein